MIFLLLFALALTGGCKRQQPWQNLRIELDDGSADAKRQSAGPLEKGLLESWIVWHPDENRVLSHFNAKMPLMGASTFKLLSAAAALQVLGPFHRFSTTLEHSGEIGAGELNGDLILRGGGDPELKIEDLFLFIARLKHLGIKKINGRLLVDESWLPSDSFIDPGMESDASYNPGISALSLQYNLILANIARLKAATGKQHKKNDIKKIHGSNGQVWEAWLVPSLDGFRLAPYLDKNQEKGTFLYRRSNGMDVWKFPEDFAGKKLRKWLPVKKPALYCGMVFRQLALMHGLELPQPQLGEIDKSQTQILEIHYSRELKLIVHEILEYSLNLGSELLFLATARSLANRRLSRAESAQFIASWLGSNLKHVDWKGLKLVNGSGLSSKALISAEQLLACLIWFQQLQDNRLQSEWMLPVSGIKGSLRSRFSEPQLQMRVAAKTGTLFYATALAGMYHHQQAGPRLFVYLVNQPQFRAKIDNPADPQYKKLRQMAPGWTARVKNRLDAQIAEWILKPEAQLFGPVQP